MQDRPLQSALCHSTETGVVLRGHDLVDDIIGRMSFTETLFMLITGARPTQGQQRILDAVLVTLMDHGMTPHAIAARMTYLAAPDSIQGAIAAGILGVGGQFAGTMEGSAQLLLRIADAADPAAEATAIAEDFRARREPLPGFGHPHHRPDDPRSPRLFAVAAESGVDGRYVAALQALGKAVDATYGRHITINATGAIAAVLLEIGIPAAIMRGVAVVSRAGGLLAQLNEERERRLGVGLLSLVEASVAYDGPMAGA